MVLGLPNKPSIAAQPFANAGGVLDDAASIDGIGGELIDALSALLPGAVPDRRG